MRRGVDRGGRGILNQEMTKGDKSEKEGEITEYGEKKQ